MLTLASTTDTLELATTTTAAVDVLVTYADNVSGTVTPGNQTTAITTATTTTICAAPGASTQRAIVSVSIRNKSVGSANTVTFKIDKAGVEFEVISASLGAGQSLTYEDGQGWSTTSVPATGGMEFLGSTVLTGNAVTTGALTIAARDVLMLMVRVTGYSGADIASLRFNGDSAANYWSRYVNSVAGGVVFTNNQNVSQTLARLFGLTTTLQRSALVHITNNTGTSKVGAVTSQTSTGAAATAGNVEFGGFEWVNTAAQITSIEMRTAGGAITMPAGTGFAVWGRNL